MNEEGRVFHVQHALLPTGWAEKVTVAVANDGRITRVEPTATNSEPVLNGVLLPGLVNAHTHLEQSWRTTSVPGGQGFVPWAKGLRAEVAPEQRGLRLRKVAQTMKNLGTAAVSDIAGWEAVFPIWADVGMQGIIQREFLGFSPSSWPAVVESIQTFEGERAHSLWERPAAHAPYSTPPKLIQAALGHPGPGPGSIHIAEDPAELDFLLNGVGPFAEWMDEMGVDWRWWTPPGQRPVHYLAELDVLGPTTLAVHGVHLSESEGQILSETETPLCLCPRSNLHIGGQLPDVPQLMASGVKLCLGTDSLASSPDLDVLMDAKVLADTFPTVPVVVWLHALTQGGADALGLSHLGRLQVGANPGLLFFDGCLSPEALLGEFDGKRVWLSEPGGRA